MEIKLTDHAVTDFGFTKMSADEKTKRIAEVFHSVAPTYDLMNDVMSFGLHRLWKRFALAESAVRAGHIVLDVACGTGDLTRVFAKKVGKNGRVILADINEHMLERGRARLIDEGIVENVFYVQANAECLPFSDNYFDCISIAFGLRNITHQAAALRSMYRVLKPGGRVLILEFSKPASAWLRTLYDAYSFKVIPKLGAWISQDEKSYQYLVESIRMHPDQETLKNSLQLAGFEEVQYDNLTGGIVALHKGFKY